LEAADHGRISDWD